MFENQRKSLIQHCKRNDLRLLFKWTKVDKKCQNSQISRVLENLKFVVKQCYQIGQFQYDKNWWKMPKSKISNATFWAVLKHCESPEKMNLTKKKIFLDQKRLFRTVCIDMVFFKNQAFRDRWWCRRSHKNRE